MRKTGLLIIVILALAIVAFSSMTYAFYSSSRAEFTFVVESDVGSSIGLNLVNSSKALKPANTSAAVGNYSKASNSNGESYAVFLVQYNASSALNVDFYITNVDYKDKSGNSFSAGHIAYLDSILKYSIKLETTLNTYHLVDDTYDTPNLHTLVDDDWKFKYDSTSASTIAATSFNFPSVAIGQGYLFCYIKFDVSQELVPPQYDDMTISFTIASKLN